MRWQYMGVSLLVSIGLLAYLGVSSSPVPAASPEYYFIYINGKAFSSTVGEANPYPSASGRMMVPVRLLTYMGASIDEMQQNFKDGTVALAQPGMQLALKVGERRLLVNGKVVKLDVSPVVVRTAIFVPLRALAEALGANVHYAGLQKKVYVYLPAN